jgi:long-chain acyl-CoA synthetase
VVRDSPAVTTEELIAFTRDRVAKYKWPRLVVVADELPHGPTGKILRREIDREDLRHRLSDSRLNTTRGA